MRNNLRYAITDLAKEYGISKVCEELALHIDSILDMEMNAAALEYDLKITAQNLRSDANKLKKYLVVHEISKTGGMVKC
jgi:hypothetical protein